MHCKYTFGTLLTALAWSHLSYASQDLHKRIPCADPRVKSLISAAESLAGNAATRFCSSYLQYTQPTVTITATTLATATSTVIVIKGFTTVVTTTTVTKPGPKRDEKLRPRATDALSADAQGKVLDYPRDIVSGACSCIAPKPTKPSTTTSTLIKTTTIVKTETRPETRTSTVTVTKPPGPPNLPGPPKSSTTQSSSTQRTTIKSSASTSKAHSSSTTATASLTKCGSSNPTFYIQFKDASSSRIDGYGGKYLGQEPDTYRGLGIGDVVTTVDTLSQATLLTLELSTRRLSSVKDGRYAEAEYYLNLTPIYFDPEDFIIKAEYSFLDCSISSGILTCSVPYPGFRNVMQTCPEYVQYYYTPVALGGREYTAATGGPNCYEKKMIVVPACSN